MLTQLIPNTSPYLFQSCTLIYQLVGHVRGGIAGWISHGVDVQLNFESKLEYHPCKRYRIDLEIPGGHDQYKPGMTLDHLTGQME